MDVKLARVDLDRADARDREHKRKVLLLTSVKVFDRSQTRETDVQWLSDYTTKVRCSTFKFRLMADGFGSSSHPRIQGNTAV